MYRMIIEETAVLTIYTSEGYSSGGVWLGATCQQLQVWKLQKAATNPTLLRCTTFAEMANKGTNKTLL